MSFVYEKHKQYPSLGGWLLINELGDGATSKVFLGFEPKSKRYRAIKVFKKSDFESIWELQREAQTQTFVKHSSIVEVEYFYEAIILSDTDGSSRSVSAMVLELAKGGDLLLLVKRVKFLPEKLARTYFHQIIEVIEHIHSQKIAHRDIKLENFTLDADFCIKLADFGCATSFSKKAARVSVVGTSKYFAPELFSGKPYDVASADLFASAVVLFCLVYGTMPFRKATESDYFYNLLIEEKTEAFWDAHRSYSKKRAIESELNSELKSLMTSMLNPDPQKRLSLFEIKKHPWYLQDIYTRLEVKELVLRMIN